MFKSLKTRFIVLFGSFIFLSLGLISILSIFTIKATAVFLAREEGAPIVQKVASYINGDDFERFLTVMDENDPYYEETRLWMLDIKQSTGCKFLYTMAKYSDGTYHYIIDGSCDPSDEDNFSPLGEEEDLESWGEMPLLTMRTGETTFSDVENQEDWGKMISTYTGIVNSRGKVVGLIGCDVDVEGLFNYVNKKIFRTGLISFFFFVLGCALVFGFTRYIFNPMKKISAAMEQISMGGADLTSRIPDVGGLELNALVKDCNGVISSLANLIEKLQKESAVLSETGNQLNERMEYQVGGINNIAEKIEEIDAGLSTQNEYVSELSNNVTSVETGIRTLDSRISAQVEAISEASGAIEKISTNIDSVNSVVERISADFENLVQESQVGKSNQAKVSEQVLEITEQSKNLNVANQVIANIAAQTNLLAMNAAIEAAHAGEAGKGFAVVADEIRKLAETSAKQTHEIQDVLEGIAESIEKVGNSSSHSSKSFETVGSHILEINTLMKEVMGEMAEQHESASNILKTMETLHGTTSEITTASNQMKEQSKKLFTGIEELQNMSGKTHAQADMIFSSVGQVKEATEVAVEAGQKNRESSDSVIKMITGFKV